MKSLIKYEFRNTKKNIFYIGLVGMVISLIIQWSLAGNVGNKAGEVQVNPGGFYFSSSSFGGSLMVIKGILLAISIFSIFGILLAFFISMAHMMKKDLYTERGYLTFALPVNGYEIIGAKLIVSIIWTLFLIVLALVWNFILSMVLFGFSWSDVQVFWDRFISGNFLNIDLFKSGIKSFINIILGSAFSILMIYLALISDKIIRKRTTAGGFWIIILFIYNFIYDSLLTLIYNSIHGYTRGNILEIGFSNVGIAINLISVIILFIVNSYLIEKKVEI